MRFQVLATDYDGTLAHHGVVEPATIDAAMRWREAGGRILLVTGREVPDLLNVFSESAIFDLIVAENGALLYWPATGVERAMAQSFPRQFPELLRSRGVKELSVGRVVVATMESYVGVVTATIDELKLRAEVILNKGSVMVLPAEVDKGTGLRAALAELGVAASATVAVGDAENDQSLFRNAGYAVAVQNALPLLKDQADWVTPSGHGGGVRELIEHLIRDDLPASGRFAPPAPNPINNAVK